MGQFNKVAIRNANALIYISHNSSFIFYSFSKIPKDFYEKLKKNLENLSKIGLVPSKK
jgi:hypothetical protein